MKVNRTYSMDYDLVIQLSKRVNQSDTVCKAVRKYLNEKDKFNLSDVPTSALIASLQSKFNQFDAEFTLIQTLIAMQRTD